MSETLPLFTTDAAGNEMPAENALVRLRKLATDAANTDDHGGQWCYAGWAEKSNDAGVFAANHLSDDSCTPLRGSIEYDPENLHYEIIAACEDLHAGIVRASYIAAACPAAMLALLDSRESLEKALEGLLRHLTLGGDGQVLITPILGEAFGKKVTDARAALKGWPTGGFHPPVTDHFFGE